MNRNKYNCAIDVIFIYILKIQLCNENAFLFNYYVCICTCKYSMSLQQKYKLSHLEYKT